MDGSIGRCCVIVAAVLGAPGCSAEERAPNDFERAYTAIALDVESGELCEKISPQAVSRAPLNSPGTRVAYERSRCFFYVATRTLNPHYCQFVRQAGSARAGGFFSESNCRRMIAENRRWNASFSLDHRLILEAAGYTDTDVTERFPRHPGEDSWVRFYFSLFRLGGGEFQRRLKTLPDFSRD